MAALSQKFPEKTFEEEKAIAFLQFMWFNYFMVREGDSYLSVALSDTFIKSFTPTYQIEILGGN